MNMLISVYFRSLTLCFVLFQSRDCLARGDMVGAHSAANSARQMVRISIAVGAISIIALGVFLGVYIGVVLNSVNPWNSY